MQKLSLVNLMPLMTAIPPVIIGAIAMYHHKIPVIIFGQNIICLIIALLISYFAIKNETRVSKIGNDNICVLIAVILLLLTFADSGMEGVHRWVALGPVRFYIASIVLPIIIIHINNLLQRKQFGITALILIIVSAALYIQPDASQLTSFAIPIIILLWSKDTNKIFRYGFTVLLCLLTLFSWIFIDTLPPVSYVEKILTLAADVGIVWLILGVISLLLLPLPFILFPPRNLKLLSTCIGIYFAVILISTQFGNFPVPLMGYGVSPIIGYFISATWHIRSKIRS